MAVVYEHLRNDTDEVFYVGIGAEEKRAFSKHQRSPYWKHIVNKVGYSVNIIHKDIDWEDACKIEKLLIEKYGRKDLGLGNLVNLTDGGEGVLGVLVSEEKRKKLSEANKGKTPSEETRKKLSEAGKGRIISEEHRQKIGEANKHRIISEETRKKLSEASKGKTPSEESRQKMSESGKGRTHSEETRQKMSESSKGEKHYMFGKTLSEETRQKISLGGRNRKGVKGYYFNKAKKKYQAQIRVEGKQTYIGAFNTPEEAELAYQQAKLIYHV
jgi:hypothetical protein